MQRNLNTFPFPRSTYSKLSNAGLIVVSDIIDLKACELGKELGISAEEALSILQLVNESLKKETKSNFYSTERYKTALQILQQERSNIITFSQSLDELFEGGIQLGKVYEICGAPSVGKTQLCFQLSVDVQIPRCCGGVGGEAIYIDTEGSFMVERVAEIAKATILHCHSIFSEDPEILPAAKDTRAMDNFHVESILSNIYYFRCFDHIQLMALMHTLGDFLKDKNIKIIIIDSIAHVFRQNFEDFQLRNRLLNITSQAISKFSTDFQLAVVLTNHMTTRYGEGKQSCLVPALGDSWGHSCTYRVILHWVGPLRHALLYKSPSKNELSVPYQVTAGGIRDHIEES